jgi:asparagine synthase (glutamine-hydrolysing)
MRPDELFGGYRWYFDETLLNNKLPQNQSQFPWMQCVGERASLLREGVLGGINPYEYVQNVYNDMICDVPYLEIDDELTRRRREMFCLNYHGFMQTLCQRSQYMSQAHGLEILMPFYDNEIVEYAFNIPWKMKSYNNREKGLLRHAFNDILPEAVTWRKKSPYPKTHNPEYMSLVIKKLKEIVNSQNCRIVEIYDKNKLNELIESEGVSFSKKGRNWFGQLMSLPQTFAYLIQLEYWLTEYDISLDC